MEKSKKSIELNVLIFEEIEAKLEKVEEFLNSQNISVNDNFRLWYNDFKQIYGEKCVNLRLYILLSSLYYIAYIIVIQFIKNEKIEAFSKQNLITKIIKFQNNHENDYLTENIFNLSYFKPFLGFENHLKIQKFSEIILYLYKKLIKLNIPKEYIFDFLIQNLFSSLIRHKSGEFYTPPFLVKKMINETYNFGIKVLDPSCGSGNFLIEILRKITASVMPKREKITAINNIYGFDINPISIFIIKVNFLLILRDLFSQVKLNLYITNSLFQNSEIFREEFDLIIGNPPWYTLRDIESIEYQNEIKKLSDELKIKPAPKNILNIEISTLFFFKSKEFFMKKNAKIFFVMTKGVITGSHASRFRTFRGFKNLKIWFFDKKIEQSFNVDFICIFGQKSESNKLIPSQVFPAEFFSLPKSSKNIDYFDSIELQKVKDITLVPYSVLKKDEKVFTNKLISKENFKNLYPITESKYKKLFHKGADLNPRNLIFLRYENCDNHLAKISPDERIFKKAKFPWNIKEYEDETIEKDYIFKVIKSTELVKFYVYDYYYVFLPLSQKDLSFKYSTLKKNAKNFYDKVNSIYLNNKKETTKHNSLMDNLNRWSKLINPRQKSKIKVVYNNSGSVLNSAVIQGDFIITGDLCFYDTNNIEEAYYLAAILNSETLTNQIRIMKSSRHIFKIPLNLAIKKYDPTNKDHQHLAKLGEIAQGKAKTLVNRILEKNMEPSKIKIQNVLNKELKNLFIQIDDKVKIELKL